jgi:hypothetical protein
MNTTIGKTTTERKKKYQITNYSTKRIFWRKLRMMPKSKNIGEPLNS